jgi:hypothetical protein
VLVFGLIHEFKRVPLRPHIAGGHIQLPKNAEAAPAAVMVLQRSCRRLSAETTGRYHPEGVSLNFAGFDFYKRHRRLPSFHRYFLRKT